MLNIIIISDGWGSTKGGINAFNYDFVLGLANSITYGSEIQICLVTCGASEDSIEEIKTKGVVVINLAKEQLLPKSIKGQLEREISSFSKNDVLWVGHDFYTGGIAISCKNYHKKGKVAIFHHMNYKAYYHLIQKEYSDVEKKIKEQEEIFLAADYVFAVGPKLLHSAMDILQDKSRAVLSEIIPGLITQDPNTYVQYSNNIIGIARFDMDDNKDIMKQGKLILKSFSELYNDKTSNIKKDLKLTMMGFDSNVIKSDELKNFIQDLESKSHHKMNLYPMPFQSNRQLIIEKVKESSISAMLSYHEGFGLVGLEAIACGTPLILTENSGLYEFLVEHDLQGEVHPVNISGVDDDILKVKNGITTILSDYPTAKRKAINLANSLQKIELSDKIFTIKSLEESRGWVQQNPTQIYTGLNWINTGRQFLNVVSPDSVISQDIYVLVFDIIKWFFNYSNGINDLDLFISKLSSHFYRRFDKRINEIIDNFKNVTNTNNIDDDVLFDLFVDDEIEEYLSLNIIDILYEELTRYESQNRLFHTLYGDLDEQEIGKRLNDLWHTFYHKGLQDANQDETEFRSLNKPTHYLQYSISVDVLKLYRYFELIYLDWTVLHSQTTITRIPHRREINYLDLKGLAVNQNMVLDIPMMNIYVEPTLAYYNERKITSHSFPQEEVQLSFIKLLESRKRIVLLGNPGAGKSTYLKNAYSIIEGNQDGKMAKILSQFQIIYLKLSDYTRNMNIGLDEYVSKLIITSNSESSNQTEILSQYQFDSFAGSCIFLLDGLDEVNRLKEVVDKIKTFIELKPRSTFVISSRIDGYANQIFGALHFEHYQINALDINIQKKFIDKWYTELSSRHLISQKDKEDQKSLLLVNLEKDNDFAKLCSNPLMLTIIVLLQFFRRGVPLNKANLYSAIVDTLTDTWTKGRVMTPCLGNDTHDIYYQIAAHMIHLNQEVIYSSAIRDIYLAYYEKNKGISSHEEFDYEFNLFLVHLCNDVGIMGHTSENTNGEEGYSFVIHKTLKEYFGALYLYELFENGKYNLDEEYLQTKWIQSHLLMTSYVDGMKNSGPKERFLNSWLENMKDDTFLLKYKLFLRILEEVTRLNYAQSNQIESLLLSKTISTSQKYMFFDISKIISDVIRGSNIISNIFIKVCLRVLRDNTTDIDPFFSAVSIVSSLFLDTTWNTSFSYTVQKYAYEKMFEQKEKTRQLAYRNLFVPIDAIFVNALIPHLNNISIDLYRKDREHYISLMEFFTSLPYQDYGLFSDIQHYSTKSNKYEVSKNILENLLENEIRDDFRMCLTKEVILTYFNNPNKIENEDEINLAQMLGINFKDYASFCEDPENYSRKVNYVSCDTIFVRDSKDNILIKRRTICSDDSIQTKEVEIPVGMDLGEALGTINQKIGQDGARLSLRILDPSQFTGVEDYLMKNRPMGLRVSIWEKAVLYFLEKNNEFFFDMFDMLVLWEEELYYVRNPFDEERTYQFIDPVVRLYFALLFSKDYEPSLPEQVEHIYRHEQDISKKQVIWAVLSKFYHKSM